MGPDIRANAFLNRRGRPRAGQPPLPIAPVKHDESCGIKTPQLSTVSDSNEDDGARTRNLRRDRPVL